jgi:AcrR family transcriptional regulator
MKKKSEITRELIIEKAAQIFNKKGHFGMSLSDLTSAIGLTKGAIYGHFQDKDEIVLASFEYNVGLLSREIIHCTQNHDNSVDKLLAIGEFFSRSMKDTFEKGGCPILNGAVYSNNTHQALNAKVRLVIYRLEDFLIRIIKDGKEKKEIKEAVDEKEYAAFFLAVIEGGSLLSKTTNKPVYLMNALKQLKKIILNELKI